MTQKKFLSVVLSTIMIGLSLPGNISLAYEEKTQRTVYLHTQGENPVETVDVSTLYMGNEADVYLAVDNPNKGLFENGEHKEPQYDMNGYTVKIYFDPVYFDYASDSETPIDYTIPDRNIENSQTGSENVGDDEIDDLPTTIGYYPYRHGSSSTVINGKTYKSAYLTVFFSGDYVPQKNEGQLWYNLCKLPLKPLKTGSTDVFIDTSGSDEYTLEIFAKNQSGDLSEQTFMYNTINGGYHHIVIKDKSKPSAPVPNPSAGSYTEKQTVELKAEEGCDIYYSTDGGISFEKYIFPIDIEISTSIICYASRISDGRSSDKVSYNYEIIPKAPFLFDSEKKLIPNIYNEYSAFTVYASDKNVWGNIDDGSEIYYTFSNESVDEIVGGTDPETDWVKVSKLTQSIEITKKRTVRLVTDKMGELSDVAWYYLGVKPAAVISSHSSGEYEEKIDLTLSCPTSGAKILYTINGSDPISNGMEYAGTITVAKDTTLRAVAVYDGEYSDISSFYYLIKSVDDFGIDAFYPPGVYEGSVNVTLTPNNPDNSIKYSIDNGNTWLDYNNVLIIDKDTDIFAKAVDKSGNEGIEYRFTYKIKPLPPAFAPESTQFTNADKITIYCTESTNENTDRFELYYTTDGSDPVTSTTRLKAENNSDSAIIDITKYTVISAVVKKDGATYSNVITHSYDIVTKKPVKPITTLLPGNYTRKIGDDKGFETQFMPVAAGTEIYYTVSYCGDFVADPVPNTEGTLKYDGTPIEVKGKTTVKAVAVNIFGVKSDVGIFEYTIAPEAPKAAPSDVIGGDRLPVVPVSAVKGSTVKYEINGFENEFVCENGSFYLDTATGNAYIDKNCTEILGTTNTEILTSQAVLDIWAALDGVESRINRYVYTLSNDPDALAAPYADKETGEYEEINIDGNNTLLIVGLYSLNREDNIQYKTDNSGDWKDYDGNEIKLTKDTVLQIRSEKNSKYSAVASYVYNFVPLAPVITLPSGRYIKSPVPTTKLELDSRSPTDKKYTIMYRSNGDTRDYRYTGQEREIPHTMSFKAYVLNEDTGKISKNTIHFYIIESENAAGGSVYIATPYDVERISADVLNIGEYANGIKLLTQNKNAKIHYFYSYTKTDGTGATTNNLVYDNAAPIMVNSSMTSITITAWLEDENGRIENSDFTHTIDFVNLNVPVTSLGSEKVEFDKGTKYTIINDYPGNSNILLYYTLDGSNPCDEDNESKKLYGGEEFTLNEAVTVKAVYMSACGKCVECKNGNPSACWNKVYGKTGVYKYTVSTVRYSGGGRGVGRVIDNTRKYTKDIFGNEHPTHIGYINGYPDSSVRPDGQITREEMTSILYRIISHEYERPFAATGVMFPDVEGSRWSVHDIEYMAYKDIVYGYPDGEFKPANNLTRAEFAALICRFADLKKTDKENPFPDLEKEHWAYEDILSLYDSGLLDGYEDGTYRPENEITRAEVMKVVNKLLGRNPSEAYVKSLEYNPFNDLQKDKWHYVIVLEATITHNYYLDDNRLEIKWEDCK
ncbi:MAG: chitobiase/beta-hexosaminidase C-terminal domain-containing protein [Clostridia bacterium]|nr:chitobiase/beta-hexosaminidase C-terminal domain-containing protein [Clostridia bacterium]